MGLLKDRKILDNGSVGGISPADLARITNLENNEYKVAYFAEVNSDSGTIVIPAGATILLDQFSGGVDALVSTISTGQPTGNNPVTAGAAIVDVASFDASGNYTLTGIPSAYPVSIVYILKIDAKDWSNLTTANILEWGNYVYTGSAPVVVNNNTKVISVTLGTTAGTVTEGNDSRLSDSRNEKLIAYSNVDLTHTGSTSETILIGDLSIPVGAMSVNSVLLVDALLFAVGTANTKSFRFYINTTANTLVGATTIGLVTLSATGLITAFQRRIANKNSLALNNCYVVTANTAYENVANTNPRAAINIDFSVQQYLIVAGVLANGADTLGIDSVQVKISKP